MGTTAARHASQIINNCSKVLAIEAICAAQAADYRGVDKLAPKTKKLYEQIRTYVSSLQADRSLSDEIEALAEWLKTAG